MIEFLQHFLGICPDSASHMSLLRSLMWASGIWAACWVFVRGVIGPFIKKIGL